MGKPSFLPKKRFIEDIEEKLKNRNAVLAKIQEDRVNL